MARNKTTNTKPDAAVVDCQKRDKAEPQSSLIVSTIVVLSLLTGLALSLYALYVEHEANLDSLYVATCDISEKVSCSKVFLSKYGKIFSHLGLIPADSVLDQPNSIYGIVFYIFYGMIFALCKSTQNTRDFLLLLSVSAMVLSAYLSYILAVELQDICVVCFTTYVCNIVLFIFSSISSLSG